MSSSSGSGSHDKTHDNIVEEQESSKIRRLIRRLVLAERRPNKARKVLTPCSGSQSNILQPSFSCDKDNGNGKRSLDAQGSTIVGRNYIGKENIYDRAINDCAVNLMSSFDDVASPVLEFMESAQSHVSNLTHSTPLNGHMPIGMKYFWLLDMSMIRHMISI